MRCVPVYFGEPFPNWILARARAQAPEWPIGWWGLIHENNDPEFIWELTPTPSPVWGMTEAEEDGWFDNELGTADDMYREMDFLDDNADKFLHVFESAPVEDGYELIKSAATVGFPIGQKFSRWLFYYLGEYLKTAEMVVDENSDVWGRDRNMWIDKSIGREPLRSIVPPEIAAMASNEDDSPQKLLRSWRGLPEHF